MSIHGECFDEGQGGRCGQGCSVYQGGRCDISSEIRLYNAEEIITHLELYPDDYVYLSEMVIGGVKLVDRVIVDRPKHLSFMELL